MNKEKKKIEYKPKKHAQWEDFVTTILNGKRIKGISFYPDDGDIYIPLDHECVWSLVIKSDGTWSLS